MDRPSGLKMKQTKATETIISTCNKPIILIGMMGSGKTTLGRALAKACGRHFFDSDTIIEALTGKTIPEIFATEGDAKFREYEYETIKNLLAEQGSNCVISTGGGCITLAKTADMIFERSLCIWLDAPLETLVGRTSRQTNRPLLAQGNPQDILEGLLVIRRPIYSRAPIHFHSDDKPVASGLTRLMGQIEAYLLGSQS